MNGKRSSRTTKWVCITSNVVAGKAHELARLYKCSSYPPIYKWVVGEPTCWQANLAKLPGKKKRAVRSNLGLEKGIASDLEFSINFTQSNQKKGQQKRWIY